MNKNPKCQFEIISEDKIFILNSYDWCINNLNLTDGKGILYLVDRLYIITSSQKIIDKVNKHFGSNFSFENFWDTHKFYKNELN